MATCCGAERASRYCPDCGKALAPAPILSLLAHLRSVARRHRADLEESRRWVAEHPKAEWSTVPGDIEAGERLVAKWESWAAAVEALLDEAHRRGTGEEGESNGLSSSLPPGPGTS